MIGFAKLLAVVTMLFSLLGLVVGVPMFAASMDNAFAEARAIAFLSGAWAGLMGATALYLLAMAAAALTARPEGSAHDRPGDTQPVLRGTPDGPTLGRPVGWRPSRDAYVAPPELERPKPPPRNPRSDC